MRILIAALLILAGMPALGNHTEDQKLAIIDRLLPKVRSIQQMDGSFHLPEPIVIAPQSDASGETARILDVDLRRRTGRGVKLSSDATAKSAILLRIEPGKDPEAYQLEVSPQGVTVTGQGKAGLFYGTRTLLQLIEDGSVPCCKITDSPDYRHRMVLYDLAREQTCNMRYMKQVIDMLADHKINMLHLYLENRFEFTKHPEITPPGVMTRAQARELDDYAAARFVEIVPEYNCLGHMENSLGVEKYRHLSETPSSPWEICTLNPEAVKFVEDNVRDLASAFRSPYFHMGGDESYNTGTCPKCSVRAKEDGGKQKLFSDYYTHMAGYIKSLGKRPMMWGDMLLQHRGASEAMPKDIIILDWHYDHSSVETVRYFTSQGYKVYASPATLGMSRHAAPSPYTEGMENIYAFIGQGKEGGAIGQCTCSWELRMGHLFALDCWGILLSADRSWNLGAGDIADFEKRFCKEYFGLDDLRPVEYFKEVSDRYGALIESVIPRTNWTAFYPMGDTERSFGKAITPEMLAKSDEHLAKTTALLDDLRASAKRNRDVLEFADMPAKVTHFMLTRFAFQAQADELIQQAQAERATDPASADSKLKRAIGLLEQIDAEAAGLKPRFRGIVERYGGSEQDIARVSGIQQALAARINEARGMLSK